MFVECALKKYDCFLNNSKVFVSNHIASWPGLVFVDIFVTMWSAPARIISGECRRGLLMCVVAWLQARDSGRNRGAGHRRRTRDEIRAEPYRRLMEALSVAAAAVLASTQAVVNSFPTPPK